MTIRMNYLFPGTEIKCPSCKRVMVRAKCEIRTGMTIGSKNFDQVEFRGESGSKTLCPFDNAAFSALIDGRYKLYTDEGWK